MTASRALVLTASLALALTAGACGSGTTTARPDASVAATPTVTTTPSPTTTSGPKDSAEVLQRMRTAVRAASSARAVGYVVNKGEKITLEVAGNSDGTNSTATLSTTAGSFALLAVDGAMYLKADAAFWKSQGQQQAATVLAGKWVKLTEQMRARLPQFNLRVLLDTMTSPINAGDLNPPINRQSRDGTDVYVLTGIKGEGELRVATDGSWLPMRFVGRPDQGDLTFSEWNSVKPFSAPPADQVVDPSKSGR